MEESSAKVIPLRPAPGSWSTSSKKTPMEELAEAIRMNTQVQAQILAETREMKRMLGAALSGAQPEPGYDQRFIIPAERNRTMAEILSDIDHSLFENTDGV